MSDEIKLTTFPPPRAPRELYQSEYGWEAGNPDGSLTHGGLFVRWDGVVIFRPNP